MRTVGRTSSSPVQKGDEATDVVHALLDIRDLVCYVDLNLGGVEQVRPLDAHLNISLDDPLFDEQKEKPQQTRQCKYDGQDNGVRRDLLFRRAVVGNDPRGAGKRMATVGRDDSCLS